MNAEQGEFIAALNRFSEKADAVLRAGPSNSATVNQTPGSGLVIACAVLVGMNIVMSGVVGFLGMRVLDLDDKLSAIYMMAPHLKKED